MLCHNCKTEVAVTGAPARAAVCPKCSAYLHCCLNCRFYDANAHNQCREPQAEWVKDKEMANFCDFFEAALQVATKESARKEAARKKLEELFKRK